jgi:hypothetical protein
MFSNGKFKGSEIPVPIGEEHLNPFLLAITNPKERGIEDGWINNLVIIEFCHKYGCDTLAKEIMYECGD